MSNNKIKCMKQLTLCIYISSTSKWYHIPKLTHLELFQHHTLGQNSVKMECVCIKVITKKGGMVTLFCASSSSCRTVQHLKIFAIKEAFSAVSPRWNDRDKF